MSLVCNTCGVKASMVLKPRGDSASTAPTVICARCDYVKAWPVTIRALRKR